MIKKFSVSFKGMKEAFNHKAVKIQLVLALMAIVGGIVIHLDFYEWLAFMVCIGLVITCEIINTAIEKIGDYLNSSYDDRIKSIKDISSGAVLFSSLTALSVCLFCVLRRLL